MKIVSVDNVYIYPKHIKQLETFGEVIIYHNIPSEMDGIKRIIDADIVIDNWYEMPARVIASALKLKLIAVAATGYEWIDLAEVNKHNITVCNSPAYATEAVAEHTIGLMLNAIHLASSAEYNLRKGEWNPLKYKGIELKNKSLAIIGYGTIGKRIANIAQAGFGMKVNYINSSSSTEDLHKSLSISDIISVNLPLNNKTRNFIGKNEFTLMKNDVVIVNTGRGATINEEALINNLKSKKIFAAGLDVFSKEPLNRDNPLFSFTNVTMTPHIAFNTKESEFRLSKIVTDNIVGYLNGKPQNVINK